MPWLGKDSKASQSFWSCNGCGAKYLLMSDTDFKPKENGRCVALSLLVFSKTVIKSSYLSSVEHVYN